MESSRLCGIHVGVSSSFRFSSVAFDCVPSFARNRFRHRYKKNDTDEAIDGLITLSTKSERDTFDRARTLQAAKKKPMLSATMMLQPKSAVETFCEEDTKLQELNMRLQKKKVAGVNIMRHRNRCGDGSLPRYRFEKIGDREVSDASTKPPHPTTPKRQKNDRSLSHNTPCSSSRAGDAPVPLAATTGVEREAAKLKEPTVALLYACGVYDSCFTHTGSSSSLYDGAFVMAPTAAASEIYGTLPREAEAVKRAAVDPASP